MNACAVLVFAKAPVPGQVKTRLIPALGPEGAASLARRLLRAAVREAVAARVGPVELCCSPDSTDPAFAAVAARHGVELTEQGDGDLGQRMQRAFARALATHRAALLAGTDIPGVDAAYLRAAAVALIDHDAVFGPARDGGYVLVGLRRPAPGLFDGIAWSTPLVMQQTRERLLQLGLTHDELPWRADIDEPADLEHLPSSWLDDDL